MRSLLISAITALAMLHGFLDPAFGQVTVSGTTYQLKSSEYQVLPNVQIQVYRNGAYILPEPPRSDNEGKFEFEVPGSKPFDVVFFGTGKLPEMYTLAGKSGTTDEIHVVVITSVQARRMGIVPEERIRRVIRNVRRDRDMIEKMQKLQGQLKEQDELLETLGNLERGALPDIDDLDNRIRQLQDLRLIRPRPNAIRTRGDLPRRPSELRDLYQVTGEGQQYLKQRSKVKAGGGD